jgi:hypothetical protein
MSSPRTAPNCISERVLIQWSESGSPCYLGSKEDDLQMTIRLDTQSDPELLLWFHLPVKVKRDPRSRKARLKSLYFVIQADMFECSIEDQCLSLQPLDIASTPSSTLVALHHAELGLNDMVSRLHFRLRTHGEVFIPNTESALIPVSEKASDAVVGLKSLSLATSFYVYMMDKGPALRHLCQQVSAGAMKNHAIDFATYTHCNDGMSRNAWENFDLHRNLQKPKICPATKEQQLSTLENAEQPLSFPPPRYDGIRLITDDILEKDEMVHADYLVNGDCSREEDAHQQTSTRVGSKEQVDDLGIDQNVVETEDEDDLNTESHVQSSRPDMDRRKRKAGSVTPEHRPLYGEKTAGHGKISPSK